MNRRRFLALLGLTGLGAAAVRYWPEQGWRNPCLRQPLPHALRQHPLVQAAWEDIDPARRWDSHVHLAGSGDSDSGIWVNPEARSLLHPVQYIQYRFYLDAACVDDTENVDRAYVDQLVRLQRDLHPASRLMLLAFDYHHDAAGRALPRQSHFHVSNEYAARLRQRHPQAFEWIASIHPYREDCVTALDWAVAHGARAVKWLPSAMGIDPASPRCDPFYAALQRHDMPLLSHAGAEYALGLSGAHPFNHPLRLRRPLNQGVKVIVAHCATIGSGPDLDQGTREPKRRYFDFFARLMADRHYEGLVFGDISAILQINRQLEVIRAIYRHEEWHGRLLNGSDYPLPGVMPMYSLGRYRAAGALSAEAARILTAIRPYNPLMFDFVLKRSLSFDGARLPGHLFETARFFGG